MGFTLFEIDFMPDIRLCEFQVMAFRNSMGSERALLGVYRDMGWHVDLLFIHFYVWKAQG